MSLKLQQMTATTTLASTDVIYVVKDPTTAPLDRKITFSDLQANFTVASQPTYSKLRSQTTGSNKTFVVPSGTVFGLQGSDFPVVYEPDTDFSVAGTVLTINASLNAPSAGSNLMYYYFPTTSPAPATTAQFTVLTATQTPSTTTPVFAFTFPSAVAQPLFIVADNVMLRATTATGVVNWTWSGTTATMTLAPTEDIVAISASASTVLNALELPNIATPVLTFTFLTATAQPAFLVIDGVLTRPTSNNGTINWTWSGTVATLFSAPTNDIAALTSSTGVIAATEVVNGSTSAFTFPSATAQPSFVVIDGAVMRATTSSGVPNWTWSGTTATCSVTPNEDIIIIV